MSLHDKLLMHNLALANKENPDFISELPQVEPKPYKDGNKVKWRNKKLKNKSATELDSLIKICIPVINEDA